MSNLIIIVILPLWFSSLYLLNKWCKEIAQELKKNGEQRDI